MKSAVQMGLNSGNISIADLEPFCPSGNCTFPPYLSLAVCTSFADVTDQLTVRNMTLNYTLASNVSVATNQYLASPGYLNVTSAATAKPTVHGLAFDDSIAFRDLNDPLADFFVIRRETAWLYSKPSEAYNGAFGATEVLLQWCVQNFTTSVSNGQAITVRHNSFRDVNSTGFPTIQVPGNEESDFKITLGTHVDLQRYLKYALSGWVEYMVTFKFVATTDAAELFWMPFSQVGRSGPDAASLHNGMQGTNETGLEFLVNNIATSMTN